MKILWTLLAAGLIFSGTTARADQYIRCGTLIDVEAGKTLKNQHIVIREGRITGLGNTVEIPSGAEEIDLSTSTCLPGLFDTHAHLANDGSRGTGPFSRSSVAYALIQLRQARTTLHNGFTTVRSMAEAHHYGIMDVKAAIDRGELEGPRLVVAPHMWGPTGGHGDINNIAGDSTFDIAGNRIKAGVDNVREKVREEIKYGADWIKIAASGGVMSERSDVNVASFTQEEINAFADETHRYKKKIAAHAHGNAGALMVAKAGFDSIEHGTMIEDDTIDLMIKNNVWLVPTVWIINRVEARCKPGVAPPLSESTCRKIKQVRTKRDASFKRAYKRGVKIAFGVDAIFGIGDAPKEFGALVDLGVSPMDALRMATINSAEMLGFEKELGSLKVGKIADIVAVKENPLQNIREMEKVHFVMKEGVIVKKD